MQHNNRFYRLKLKLNLEYESITFQFFLNTIQIILNIFKSKDSTCLEEIWNNNKNNYLVMPNLLNKSGVKKVCTNLFKSI